MSQFLLGCLLGAARHLQALPSDILCPCTRLLVREPAGPPCGKWPRALESHLRVSESPRSCSGKGRSSLKDPGGPALKRSDLTQWKALSSGDPRTRGPVPSAGPVRASAARVSPPGGALGLPNAHRVLKSWFERKIRVNVSLMFLFNYTLNDSVDKLG